MADCIKFPDTVEEFMEQYKVTDSKQVYTNGTELVPIFRMKQWFEHQSSADVASVVRCRYCIYSTKSGAYMETRMCNNECAIDDYVKPDDFCSYGERREKGEVR